MASAEIVSNLKLIISGNVPTTSNLANGEFAFGLVDGVAKLYGNVNGTIVDFSELTTYYSTTVTIATSAWSNKSATVSVNGVTASNNIFVTPSASSYIAYANARIRCTAQGNGTLTFACETTPTTAITVNILIFNS